MSRFLGVVRYEFHMAVRRWGVWLAFAGAGLAVASVWRGTVADTPQITMRQWPVMVALIGNTLMPVVGGIAVADRLVRDRTLNVRELLWATPLSGRAYVLGKYAGVMLAVLAPALLAVLATAGLFVAEGLPAALLVHVLLPFLAINVPAYLFIGAFSLAGPEALPLRVYQVLFTGYWFWGNFIPPQLVPTLNGTLLTPKGDFVAGGLFGLGRPMIQQAYTPLQAWLNLGVLFACAAAALIALERYLARQTRRA